MTGGVRDAVARVRGHLRRRAAVAAALWVAAGIGLALALAWVLAGSDGWGQGSPGPLLLDLGLVALAAGLAGWVRRGERSWLAEARIARAMEDSAGLAPGTVEGALELSRAVPPGVSPSLAALAERSVAGRLSLPPERLAGSLGARTREWIRRGGAALALTAPVLVLLAVASPDRSRDAWVGLGRPLRTLSRSALAVLEVSPGDAEVLRGSPVALVVRAPGRTEVTLEWQAEGDVARTRTAAVERGEARFRFEEVTTAFDYSARTADGAETATHRITPVDPLLVSEIEIDLSFPPHTGRPAETYDGEFPPLVVPAGTRVEVTGRATRPLRDAAIEREEDGLRVPLRADGPAFTGSWTPSGAGTYAWRFHDAEGLDATLVPSPLDLTVVADSAPSIRFAFPAVDTVLPLTLEQPLVIELRDDYGVAAFDLVAYRVTSGGERQPPVVQRTDLGGSRAALARPVMDLKDWGLLPGDTVRYFARALDNAPTPSVVETREYVLRMPLSAELRRDAQAELEEMADRLDQLAQRAQRASEESRDLEREAAARAQQAQQRPNAAAQAQAGRRPEPNRAGFEQREELRQALEQQQAMAEDAQAARAELESISNALREAGASDPELERDLQELQALLDEVASPELRERLEQMATDLDQTDAREAQRTIEELAEEQERFRERLQNSLEQLRRAAVEQDFRSTVADARELGQRERALTDALREGGEAELRERQQEDLRAEAEALGERLEGLEERLSGLKEEIARAGVNQAQRTAAQAAERMQEALDALAQPDASATSNAEAAERAREAAEAMDRTASELEMARRQMSSERRAAIQALLQQVGTDALSLARRQAEIRRQMGSLRGDAVVELRGAEAALLQGLRSIAENIAIQTQGQAPIVRDAVAALGMAMKTVEETVRALEARRGTQQSPESAADEAANALNQLAIAAVIAAQPPGEGGDEGEGDLGQLLQQLAQEQGEINNQASQVLPMQLGDQAMAEQAERLSEGQEQVAEELQELAERPGSEEEALGSLDALAEEAAALAAQLAGGRLDAETRARQERLFHRLLDAGRMLENDDLSEDRQARSSETFERGEVLPLGPGALGGLRYGMPSAEQLQRLGPAERELVLRYFDRLNRSGGGSGPVAHETEAPETEAPAGTEARE